MPQAITLHGMQVYHLSDLPGVTLVMSGSLNSRH